MDLARIPYVPLPPSPNAWELRDDPPTPIYPDHLCELVRAAQQHNFTKTLRLAESCSVDDLDGPAGGLVARAYLDAFQKRSSAKRWDAAAAIAAEMVARVGRHLTDADRRKVNKVVDALEQAGRPSPVSRQPVSQRPASPLFSVAGDNRWAASESLALPKAERPDPHLRLEAVVADGMIYSDFSGRSVAAGGRGGYLVKLDFSGKKVAEANVGHDAYRIGADPSAPGVAVMDRSGTLHLYDARLVASGTYALRDDPRIREHFATTETNYWGEFRSQVRAVDVSADGKSYLFTIADEAWCCALSGSARWGLRTPLNKGWERVISRSQHHAMAAGVTEALSQLDLRLPVSPDEIKQAYRVQAHRHHPDRNRGDPDAVRRMQQINEAFEILTGVDPRSLDLDVPDGEVTSFRRTGPDQIAELHGLRLEITMMMGSAQDWIYGAAFRATDCGAFLATYSGKVVEIDANGTPLRVFDLGSVPSQIVDTGEFLYLLTMTRLYVLQDRTRLVEIVDVFQQGRLFVAPGGLGLLSEKCFRWLTNRGELIGQVSTRDPIRAIYSTEAGCVIETRQHRLVVHGLSLE